MGTKNQTSFKKGYTPWNKGKKGVQAGRIGKDHPMWKGGRCQMNIYVYLYKPEHPNSNHNYVAEHRLVMEKHLRRYLTNEEYIHHINGKKNDNRIKNLMLFTDVGKHLAYHRMLCQK